MQLTWLDTGWKETPQATNPKRAPKETQLNELREVKRPVNNINNILSRERGALWCFNLYFFLLCSASLQLLEKYVVVFHFPSRWNKKSCLLFPNSSSTPRPNPHLKWLSKELKASQRSQAVLFKLFNDTTTRGPMQPIAAWFKTKAANGQVEENHLKCYVTSDELIYILCSSYSKTSVSHCSFEFLNGN